MLLMPNGLRTPCCSEMSVFSRVILDGKRVFHAVQTLSYEANISQKYVLVCACCRRSIFYCFAQYNAAWVYKM